VTRLATLSTTLAATVARIVAAGEVHRRAAADPVVRVLDIMTMLISKQVGVYLVEGEIVIDA
jgi:hypothetical protein